MGSSERTSILSSSPSSPSHSPVTMLYLCIVLLLVPTQGADVVDKLVSNSKASTLVSLVTKAGLADALKSGTFTIFAPTDDAFSRVPQDTLNSLLADTNALADLLKYHVVSGAVYAKDIKTTCRPTPWPERRSDSTHTHITTS